MGDVRRRCRIVRGRPVSAGPDGAGARGAAARRLQRRGGAGRGSGGPARVARRAGRSGCSSSARTRRRRTIRSKMFPLLAAPLARRGIQLTYAATPAEALDAGKARVLRRGDDVRRPHRAHARAGEGAARLRRGRARVDCAPFGVGEFTGSDKYVALIGAQFQRHGTGEFTAEIVQPSNPVMQRRRAVRRRGKRPTCTRSTTPGDRTVMMERVDQQGREPWTWVRTQGKGRVFYTATATTSARGAKPGFQNLVEQRHRVVGRRARAPRAGSSSRCPA